MPRLKRRALLALALPAAAGAAPADGLEAALAALERRHGGWLGVAIRDTARPGGFAWRGDERFPMTSTFKFLAAAQVLARVEQGAERLDRVVRYEREAVVDYSPATAAAAGGAGMSIAALCEAAVVLSDNTAGNLLLASLGGPEGLTAWLRRIGDPVSRLDRWEPALNEAVPGDPRDTTTPLAMLGNLERLLLGEVLSPAGRARLEGWLVACSTGRHRLRAGVPAGWEAGDKTGGGGRNSTNDIAILRAPGRPPLLVTAYYTGAAASLAEREAVLAAIGRLAAGF